MGKRRISMNKIREIVRLSEECGLTNRQIAGAMNISRPMVGRYLEAVRQVGFEYGDVQEMDDQALRELVTGQKKAKPGNLRILTERFPEYVRELTRTGVTLKLLWEEYRAEYPDGYGLSQFCYHFQEWRESAELTMHITHKAGENMFVDFTGDRFKLHNPHTGAITEAEVFVAILPASQYIFMEAKESQKKADWILANENALLYFDGVPTAIVPDCLKSGVTKTNPYEPDINPAYADFARHYGTAIVPARPGRSRDKALAENAVKIAYCGIFAPLRDKIFHSLGELNAAIRELLDKLNDKPFQRIKLSRRELFNEVEKDKLKPLPAERYEWKEFLSLKVPANYHIELREDRHYYSVPYQYRSKRVTVIYTALSVEIYCHNMRIAYHKRDREANGYTTNRAHMAPNHLYMEDLSPDKTLQTGRALGVEVEKMVSEVLQSRKSLLEACRICRGIFSLEKKYGVQRLNLACKRALEYRFISYHGIKSILEKGLDRAGDVSPALESLFPHKNVRGGLYYH